MHYDLQDWVHYGLFLLHRLEFVLGASQPMLFVLYIEYSLTNSSLLQFTAIYKEEMETLREFYDPDTVELMEWIK